MRTTWKSKTWLDVKTRLRFTRLFTVDRAMPVVRVTGLGSGGDQSSFADADGNMVWHLGLEVPEGVEALPLPREKGASNRDADPEHAEIGIVVDADTMRHMIREMMSVLFEYERAFPVVARKKNVDGMRSRS